MTDVEQVGADLEYAGRVELSIPANPEMVSVLRTVTATLASRRDFTMEEIDDLRIAVDEACALLMPHGVEGARLSASFRGQPDKVVVTAWIKPTETSPGIDQTGFAWLVLSALADTVTTKTESHALTITLAKTRSPRN